jgi:hypothetical protein
VEEAIPRQGAQFTNAHAAFLQDEHHPLNLRWQIVQMAVQLLNHVFRNISWGRFDRTGDILGIEQALGGNWSPSFAGRQLQKGS